MDILLKIRLAMRFVLELIDGGQKCLCCGKNVYTIPICKQCAENMLRFDSRNRLRKGNKYVDSKISIFAYTGWKKDLLHEWKFEGDRLLTPLFAQCIAKVIKENHLESIPIVPVPPRPFKIRSTGWDQVDDIAKRLRSHYHLKICKALKRTARTEQKKLSFRERIKNSQSGYAKRRQLKSDSAIIIDDIITTGATTQTCARLLKEQNVHNIYVVTLFSAKQNDAIEC